jgi:hypothetical protein
MKTILLVVKDLLNSLRKSWVFDWIRIRINIIYDAIPQIYGDQSSFGIRIVYLFRGPLFFLCRFRDAFLKPRVSKWCYVMKAVGVEVLDMGNTWNAIMSLAYYRLIKKACVADLKLYQIYKVPAAWCMFVIHFFLYNFDGSMLELH